MSKGKGVFGSNTVCPALSSIDALPFVSLEAHSDTPPMQLRNTGGGVFGDQPPNAGTPTSRTSA